MTLEDRIKLHKNRLLEVASHLEDSAKAIRVAVEKDDLPAMALEAACVSNDARKAVESSWHLYGIMQGAGARDAR